MKGQTYVILSIVVVILIAVFAVTNVDDVSVNYLFWKAESPLILVILFSVLMGGLLTATAGSVRMFHLRKENKELMKELEIARSLVDEKKLAKKMGHHRVAKKNDQKSE